MRPAATAVHEEPAGFRGRLRRTVKGHRRYDAEFAVRVATRNRVGLRRASRSDGPNLVVRLERPTELLKLRFRKIADEQAAIGRDNARDAPAAIVEAEGVAC